VAVRKFQGTGSILNVKKIRKHLDENDAASVLVFHSVEENPQMSLRNRVLQTGIDFFITYYLIGFANNKWTEFHKSKPIFLIFHGAMILHCEEVFLMTFCRSQY
jgi:hypothetical protein